MDSPLYTAIVEGDFSSAAEETQTLLDQGITPQEILNSHLLPAMNEVGRLYDEGDYFVPELLMASKGMQEAMTLLDPLLKAGGTQKLGYVVIGTVAGDMHDIGKNLVASMLEGAGYEVHDLGTDVSTEKFLDTACQALQSGVPRVLILLSALLTTTMPEMKKTIDAVRERKLTDQIKVLIGGAPTSESFAQQIGADGYSENAYWAVKLAEQFRI